MLISHIKNKVLNRLRSYHLSCNRRRLKNHSFSIIANNCIGGIIYHDLNEQFRSPTINLWMTVPDFVVFCEHLEYYLQLPIQEIYTAESYPVGELYGEYGNVRIFFQHYKTFEEAIAKWEDRAKRINWDSIYIICEAPFEEETTVKKLLALPYRKRIFTHTHTHNWRLKNW